MAEWNGIQISENTRLILEKLEERKKKFEAVKKWGRIYSIIALISAALFLFICVNIEFSISGNPFDTIGVMAGNKLLLFFLLLTAAAYFQSVVTLGKAKKLELKYEALRKESITHLEASLRVTKDTQLRDEIARVMRESGINVTYIS